MRLPPRRQLARVIPLVCQESVEVVSQRRLRANEHRVGEVALEVSGGQTREGLVSPGAEFDESFDEFCKPLRRPRLGHRARTIASQQGGEVRWQLPPEQREQVCVAEAQVTEGPPEVALVWCGRIGGLAVGDAGNQLERLFTRPM